MMLSTKSQIFEKFNKICLKELQVGYSSSNKMINESIIINYHTCSSRGQQGKEERDVQVICCQESL